MKEKEMGPAPKTPPGAPRLGAFYNEFDKPAAAWLRELGKQGWIANGEVNEKSIAELGANDLAGVGRAHFFAGIGGWDLALQLAGWPDDRPVWTGSCPCQPFSAAGKRKGVEDSRHLWPEFCRLITECRPPIVFGEQVASADGRLWLAGVRSDLEALGYAVGAADLCSAGVGAPNIRQRLYWVAVSQSERLHGGQGSAGANGWDGLKNGPASGGMAQYDRLHGDGAGSGASDVCRQFGESPEIRKCSSSGLGDTEGGRRDCPSFQELDGEANPGEPGRGPDYPSGGFVGLEFSQGHGREQRRPEPSGRGSASGCGLGYWDAFDILPCLDGKARRIEPGSFPLAHGVSGRVGLLRGYGNAINPFVAAEFIQAFLEAETAPRAPEARSAGGSP